MQAELQPARVQIVGDRLERMRLRRHRKTVGRWQQAAIGVHFKDRAFAVFGGMRERLIPLDVNRDEIPAVRFEVRGHVIGVGERVRLPDARAVAVPGVPAHRRRLRPGPIGGIGGARRKNSAEYSGED